MTNKQRTLKTALLQGGTKGRFYLDITKSTRARRAYEVLNLWEDTSATLSTGVEMRVNLYVEGNKEPIRSTLNMAMHLNDSRVTRKQCYDILQPLEARERGVR